MGDNRGSVFDLYKAQANNLREKYGYVAANKPVDAE